MPRAVVVLLFAFVALGVRIASAQEISTSFSTEEVWAPSQAAVHALFGCQPRAFTCVQQVMNDDGASPDAIAFFGLTGWFLSHINDTSPVQIATVFTPWRANENSQPVLVGGTPAVVYLEREVPSAQAQASNDFQAIRSAHPNALFWGASPTFDRIDTSPQGGQRFVYRYRVLDGCHACAILAMIPVAFDFSGDGTYESAQVLSGP